MGEETRTDQPNHTKGQLEPKPQEGAQVNCKKRKQEKQLVVSEVHICIKFILKAALYLKKGQSVQVGISTLLVSIEKSNGLSFYFCSGIAAPNQ